MRATNSAIPDRHLPMWLLAVPTLLLVAAIWLDLTPWLRGPDEWRWNLRQAQAGWRILYPIGLLGLYVFVCARLLPKFDGAEPPRPSTERGFLAFLTLAAPLIQFALSAAVNRNPLFEFFAATVSPAVTGYYSVAVTTPDLPAQLPHYTTFMQTLPIHPQTHPPGLVLIHWLGWRVFDALPGASHALALLLRTMQCHNVALMTLDDPQIASAVIGMSIPLIGAFAVWPIYAFGKRVAGPRTAAIVAAIFPILPLYAMWSSQWDQVFPLLLFAALYLAHTGLESGSAARPLASGAVLSLATFLSVGNAVLIVIIGLYGAAWMFSNRSKNWIRPTIAFVAGCLSVWVVYAVVYRVSVSDLIDVGYQLALEGTRCPMCPSTTRSYAVWIAWNPIDFATFFSLPLSLLFLARIPTTINAVLRGARVDASWTCPEQSRRGALVVAAVLPFVALVVTAIVRGEVGRMWGYFGPLFVLIALAPQADSTQPRGVRSTILLGLIALQLLAMYTRWQVTPSFLDEPPERQANFAAPDRQVTTTATFDHQIALRGYDLNLAKAAEPSQGSLDLTLYWQALAQPPHAYTVFVHVLDVNGQPIGQQDNMPLRDQLPTSCWQPGEVVADPYHIDLPGDVHEPLSLEVGMYRFDSGERLNLDDGSGTSLRLSLTAQ